jgi:hypothetical protein
MRERYTLNLVLVVYLIKTWLDIWCCQNILMKNFFYGVVLLFAFSSVGAQVAERDAVASALSSGNSNKLSEYFAKTLDLTLIDSEEVYSKEQAKVILTRFFSENRPSEFNLKHEGQSKLQDHYFIGDLVTDKGVYRITYFLKKENSDFRIKQLRIEE